MENGQFPSEITQLAPLEALHVKLSASMSTFVGDNPEEEHRTTPEQEMKARSRFPFNYCPPSALSILMLASAFVGPQGEQSCCSLYIFSPHHPSVCCS